MYKDIKRVNYSQYKISKINRKNGKRPIMTQELIDRIIEFNKIKYGENDNETRIVFATLKPEGTVTTALKNKE